MILLILFAFLAGFVTILSPCILPVLPIVLSSSLSGGKKRPLGVVTGFIGSFTFFTLFLSSIVRNTGLSADFLRNTAIVLILLSGSFLIIPQAQVVFEKLISKLSSLQKNNNSEKSGFWGGVVVGSSLGLIWAPCVGPILASVITLSITAEIGLAAVLITLAYSIGTAIPMLIITHSGKKIFTKVPWLLEHTTQIQQFFGVLMIFTALGLFMRVDTKFQTYVLETFPNYGVGLTKFEDNKAVQKQLDVLQGLESEQNTMPKVDTINESGLLRPGTKAPGFQNETSWVNSEPLNLETDLKGKVVLVDFWTYTCINCIRTFPYLRDWYEKYSTQGFEIVGVHSPEFEFEKNRDNVIQASKDHSLTYPIVQDNNFAIWKAYSNRYWPAHYLIDKNGDIRYTHFGEGEYLKTENAIRTLLEEEPLKESDSKLSEIKSTRKKQTPEIYLGYKRAENYIKENNLQIDTPTNYSADLVDLNKIPNDGVYLTGNWTIESESITANEDGSTLTLNFIAQNVFLVLNPSKDTSLSEDSNVVVSVDGKQIKELTITKDDKYDILLLDETEYGRHILTLEFSKGVSAFAFTFGS